jgi:hypothetical protein
MEHAPVPAAGQSGPAADGGCRTGRPPTSTPGAGQARLDRRWQLREQREVAAASGTKLERGAHIDPDYVPAGCKPQLALAGGQRVPGFMLLACRFFCR